MYLIEFQEVIGIGFVVYLVLHEYLSYIYYLRGIKALVIFDEFIRFLLQFAELNFKK